MSSQEPETMGQRLQRLRQAAGYSQPQLATRAGIPLATLRNIEQDRTEPLLRTAHRLAIALRISLDDLVAALDSSDDSAD